MYNIKMVFFNPLDFFAQLFCFGKEGLWLGVGGGHHPSGPAALGLKQEGALCWTSCKRVGEAGAVVGWGKEEGVVIRKVRVLGQILGAIAGTLALTE